MSSIFGRSIRISIFGESHSEAIGVTIEGLPPGLEIDMGELRAFLDERKPGGKKTQTSRKEEDEPCILCGFKDGKVCGTPLTAIIYNKDINRSDYDAIKDMPRPGHADYAAHVKYHGFEDAAGGGHNSGRLTAPLCFAGGICKQLLSSYGISVCAKISEIGGERRSTSDIADRISEVMNIGDSLGGIVECRISGVPPGIGDPMFEGLENLISQAVFAIPGIKGIEFGAGFNSASMFGSEMNDEFKCDKNGKVATVTNNHGGILGGISSGMDIVFRAAIKPTPSIPKSQKTIHYSTGKSTLIEIKGRHDPCIVPRAVPCVEAAAAIAISDEMKCAGKIKE